MKDIKTGGLKELNFFKNRVGRAYGRGEINKATFERLSTKTEDLISEVQQVEQAVEVE